MRREEAEQLIGTLVSAWTAWRGAYAGELIEPVPSRPWRGKVRVQFVVELPMGDRARILKPGEILEVGGVNIKPFDGVPLTWQRSIEHLLAHAEQFLADWEKRSAEASYHMRGEAGGIEYTKRMVANIRRQIAENTADPSTTPSQ